MRRPLDGFVEINHKNMNNTETTWKTNCCECNKELSYSSKYNLERALKKNRLCLSCSKSGCRHHFSGKKSTKKGKVYSKQILEAISNNSIWFNEVEQQWYRVCPSCNSNLKSSSPSHAASRVKNICYSCVAKNRTYSKECREKMRISAIERIKRQGRGVSSFNKNACVFIENYGNKNGYKFQHALNGGEIWLGEFSLDGYDATNLIAFEYDEPYHEKRKQKFFDLSRTKILLKNEKVKEMVRYSQKYNKLYKSFPTYSTPL